MTNQALLPLQMTATEITCSALKLPVEDRLLVARQLIESVVIPEPLSAAVREGVSRLEDIATGRDSGLTEGQFRAAL
ncbi:MAG: addiction module protein [Opitutaceae bacterium]|jgi:hypothetical protein|nr:addiction module protein [Opitutaceae bacterium]